MSFRAELRPALAATVLLAVLAGAYEAAVRGPLAARTLVTVRLDQADNCVEDSAARVAAPPPIGSATSAASLVQAKKRRTNDSLTQAEERRTNDNLTREYRARLRECPPQPLRFHEARRLHPPPPRRYVGTVDGQPVTAELYWTRPDSVVGRFYFWRSGAEYSLASDHSTRILALEPEYLTNRAGGRWHLTRPLGPVLQGHWKDSTGQHGRPFVLHENYQGGVRYEIRTLTLTGGETNSHNPCDVPSISRDYLCLRGPAVRPAQGRLRVPALAGRRRQLRAGQRNDSHSGIELTVLFNDFNLLSYELLYYDWPFEGSSARATTHGLLDLTTGQPLSIYHQLRPGAERRLQWWLTMHLLDAPRASAYTIDPLNGWRWVTDHGRRLLLAPLPPETTSDDLDSWSRWTCALTAQGLEFLHNGDYALIPYRELRPLVRPGTPLARMLRARGMW